MEVVGVAFYSRKYAPFLPINVAMKWWEAVKLNRWVQILMRITSIDLFTGTSFLVFSMECLHWV
jgi:hypothetical protein